MRHRTIVINKEIAGAFSGFRLALSSLYRISPLISDLQLLVLVSCALLFALNVLSQCSLLDALCSSAWGQQSAKVPQVGFLMVSSPSAIVDRLEAFRHGLLELGYVEGKSIKIQERWADGQLDRIPELASDLMRVDLDVIVSTGPQTT